MDVSEKMAKIVVVEDEPDMAELLCHSLQAQGHEVVTTGEGLQALSLMLESIPGLVLADVMMPEMGGAPMLTAMRENAYLGEVPVILISGLAEEQVREQCTGYTAFLRKPFTLAAMTQLVDEVLAR